MPVQVCGASKTRQLRPVAEFPHPDAFRTCGSPPAPLLPVILAAGEGGMGLPGLGGGGALQEPELASSGCKRAEVDSRREMGSPSFPPGHQARPESPGSLPTRVSNPCRQHGEKRKWLVKGWGW